MMHMKLTSPFKFQFSPSLNSKKLSCEDQPHIIQGRALGLGWQPPISRMMKEGESLMPICSVSGSGSRSADWVLSSLWSHHIRSMPASLHDSWMVPRMVHNVVCCKSLHETHKLSIVWSLSPEVCQLSPIGCGIKSVNLTFREKLIQPVTEMQPTLLTQLATTVFHFLCYWLMFHKQGTS